MDARSTMIEKQCQHHLTIAGYGTTLFWSGIWWMFPLLTHVFSLWNIVQTLALVLFDSKIQNLISLSFIPQCMFLADTHARFLLCVIYTLWHPYCRNFPLPQNLRDDVMHLLHTDAKMFTDRWSATWRSHNTILSTLARGYGWVAWEDNRECQIQSAALTFFEPHAPVKHCCTLPTVVTIQMLHLRMNEWMNEWYFSSSPNGPNAPRP